MNDIIREYSSGLFELSCECNAGESENMLAEIRAIRPLFSRDYVHLLINPSISKTERHKLLDEAFGGKVSPYLVNFMKLMTERGLADSIPGSFDEFERLYMEKFDIVRVKVESAAPLNDSQKEKLVSKLENRTKKTVYIEYAVNPSLLGGMKLTIGNRMIDDSIKSKLAEIGALLSDSVL